MAESSRRYQWLGAGQSINIQGYEIKDGLVYVGKTLTDRIFDFSDICTIDPELKVSSGDPSHHAHEIGFWPNYTHLSPKCRGAYLRWLADGRSDPKARIGYVFLFFYGLERRLLINGPEERVPARERAEIVREVHRLLKIYGADPAFRSYANNLVAMEWVIYQRNKPIPDYLEISSEYCKAPFQVVLAKLVAAKKAIPWDVALQWIKFHPDHRPKLPERHCASLFKELFSHHYRQKYRKGLLVRPNKTSLSIEFKTASTSLFGYQVFRIPELSNPFIRDAPVKKIRAIAEICTRELGPYTRFVRREENHEKSLAAQALLPRELMAQSEMVQGAKNQLAQLCTNGAGLISVDRLYECFGEKSPQAIGNRQAKDLAILVEVAGFGLVPDIRLQNMKPKPNGKVAIFPDGRGIDFPPSPEYQKFGIALQLGSLIRQIDGNLSPASEEILRSQVIQNRRLTQSEKASLLAMLKWYRDAPQKLTGIKKRLDGFGKDGKAAIAHLLVLVAAAEGRITPTKMKNLEKLYRILGLDKRQVTSDLHALSAKDEPVTVGLRDSGPSYSIPTPVMPAGLGRDFSLNQELLRRRTEETHKARSVLEEIFAEREENQTETNSTSAIFSSDNPLNSLDKAHQDLFRCLVQRETWDRGKVQLRCKELGLMVDGAMEKLNEWFFENVNTPLIEDGDTVWIDVNSAKEIMDVE